MWTRPGISFLAPIHHHPPVTRVVSFGLFLSLKQLIRFPKRKATWTVKKQDCCRPPLFFSRGGSWIGHSAFLLGHTADEIEVAPITQKSTTCQREMKELLMTFRLPCCDVLESSSSSSVSSGGEDEGGSSDNDKKDQNQHAVSLHSRARTHTQPRQTHFRGTISLVRNRLDCVGWMPTEALQINNYNFSLQN